MTARKDGFTSGDYGDGRLWEWRKAIKAADRWWFHDAHGLHDDAHHAAHRPLDLCVPLLTLTDDLRRLREEA